MPDGNRNVNHTAASHAHADLARAEELDDTDRPLDFGSRYLPAIVLVHAALCARGAIG